MKTGGVAVFFRVVSLLHKVCTCAFWRAIKGWWMFKMTLTWHCKVRLCILRNSRALSSVLVLIKVQEREREELHLFAPSGRTVFICSDARCYWRCCTSSPLLVTHLLLRQQEYSLQKSLNNSLPVLFGIVLWHKTRVLWNKSIHFYCRIPNLSLTWDKLGSLKE